MAWARFVIVVERWGIWRWRPSMGLFRCVRLSEPLRQRHRAHAFLESCLQRLPKLCFLWVPKVFLVGSRSNVSRFFGLQFRNGLGAKSCGGSLPSLSLREGYSCWKPAFSFFCRSFVAEFSSITCIHFTCHCMVGHAFPFGLLCLIRMRPRAHEDWTAAPHVGQEWVLLQTTKPCRTRNCLLQWPPTCTFPSLTVLWTLIWQ